jgi:hypothetical protein
MAEDADFCEVTLTAERRGKPHKLLSVHTFMGFPNRLEELMQSIKRRLKECIKEINDRIQLHSNVALLSFFMSKLLNLTLFSTWLDIV